MIIKFIMLYDIECQIMNWTHEQKTKVTEKDENIKMDVWIYEDK